MAAQVNSVMVRTYYEIGRAIVENEQCGKARAAYGKGLLKELSRKLAKRFEKGFSVDNLENMRRFYQTYSERIPETASRIFAELTPSTQESLRGFNPLFCLNYSTTHKEHHALVYVLDALDAYNKRLVKQIKVKGFDIRNLPGTSGYLFLEGIEIPPSKPPMARLEFEIGRATAVKRVTRLIGVKAKVVLEKSPAFLCGASCLSSLMHFHCFPRLCLFTCCVQDRCTPPFRQAVRAL